MRVVAVTSLALVLSGCIGPSYRPPELHAPANFSRAQRDQRRATGDISRFWRRFHDPLLTRLIERAIARSPNMQIARARLQEARANRDLASAERFPTLGYSTNISRQQTVVGAFSGATLTGLGVGSANTTQSFTRSFFNASFDASWELDIFGVRRRELEATEAEVQASAADLAATQVSLVAEVALSYVEVRSYQSRLIVALRNLASQSETLQIVVWREMAGLVTSLDVAEARRNREQTRAAIPPLEQGLAEAEHRLAILVGLAPGALHRTLSAERPIPTVPDRVLVGIPADALRRRPDVRAAERRIAAATARIGEAEARWYPSFSISGSLGIGALIGNVPGFVYSILAGITGPIFDAGRIQSQVHFARAVTDEAFATYRSTVLTALEDAENALSGVSTSRARRAALESAHDAARDAVLLARMRYETGLVDFQTVLDSERNLLLVEDSLVTSRAEIVSNVIRLYKALGGGWSPRTLTRPS